MSPAPPGTGSTARLAGPTPLLPAYGRSSLSDLLPSVGAHLGVPGCPEDLVGLPGAQRYVVLLVDGLGWSLLTRAVRDAPYLASLLGGAQAGPGQSGRAGTLSVGVPSTTATSLTSLGTGLPPGQHGVVGYTSRIPATGEILNALTWKSALAPRTYQPRPTVFERAAAAGVAVSSVAPERFAHSGLTEAALRGGTFVPIAGDRSADERITEVVRAATRGADRSLVYAYERELDHCGHALGCESAEWLRQLVRIDAWCERLRDALPADVVLLVTGDHGMVDIPPGHQIVLEDHSDLVAGLSAVAGEGRFRQLYVDAEPAARVAQRWRDRLGDRAWVATRDEAIEQGWFGTVSAEVAPRYGHVLVAMTGDWAAMTRQFPREFDLVGMHGSLTREEMLVPLLVD